MNTQTHLKTGAIATLSLGCIHTLAAPLIILNLRYMPLIDWLSVSCMFVLTGFAVASTGLLQLFLLKRLQINNDSKTLFKASIVFMIIYGFFAVACMWTNPFAYIMLLVSLYEEFFFKIFNKYKHETSK